MWIKLTTDHCYDVVVNANRPSNDPNRTRWCHRQLGRLMIVDRSGVALTVGRFNVAFQPIRPCASARQLVRPSDEFNARHEHRTCYTSAERITFNRTVALRRVENSKPADERPLHRSVVVRSAVDCRDHHHLSCCPDGRETLLLSRVPRDHRSRASRTTTFSRRQRLVPSRC